MVSVMKRTTMCLVSHTVDHHLFTEYHVYYENSSVVLYNPAFRKARRSSFALFGEHPCERKRPLLLHDGQVSSRYHFVPWEKQWGLHRANCPSEHLTCMSVHPHILSTQEFLRKLQLLLLYKPMAHHLQIYHTYHGSIFFLQAICH
jgi:hypothetical protein